MDSMTADKYFDPDSRITWLEFGKRLPEENFTDITKSHGWRYIRYREQFYNNRRYPSYPSWLSVVDCGEVRYAEERSDRLKSGAMKANARGDEALDRCHKIADRIPLGQPIIVGHHSERGARRDVERMQNLTRQSIREHDKAEYLNDAAESSKKHQAYKHNPGVIARRIERLDAEIATLKKNGYGPERIDQVQAEIDTNKAELEALGGLTVEGLDIKKGDFILAAGYGRCKVLKVCKKSVSCLCIDSEFLSRLYPNGYAVDKTKIVRKLSSEEIAPLIESEGK